MIYALLNTQYLEFNDVALKKLKKIGELFIFLNFSTRKQYVGVFNLFLFSSSYRRWGMASLSFAISTLRACLCASSCSTLYVYLGIFKAVFLSLNARSYRFLPPWKEIWFPAETKMFSSLSTSHSSTETSLKSNSTLARKMSPEMTREKHLKLKTRSYR